MSTTASLTLSCGADSSCPDTLLEIPEAAVDPGERIIIRLWGPTASSVLGFRLVAGTQNLGTGSPNTYSGQTHCKFFEWAGDNKAQQFDWPVTAITRILAYSPLYTVNAAGNVVVLATAGEDITEAGLFVRRGHACIVPTDPQRLLYGTVHVTAARAAYCREWSWSAPTDPTGAQWFWLYQAGELSHKFSLTMSDEPDDASIALVDFKITVIARRTAGAVANASVYLDGVLVGTTDPTYGYVKVFRHLSGTFPIRVVAAGYTSTDQDDYSDNDTITVDPDGSSVKVKIGSYTS